MPRRTSRPPRDPSSTVTMPLHVEIDTALRVSPPAPASLATPATPEPPPIVEQAQPRAAPGEPAVDQSCCHALRQVLSGCRLGCAESWTCRLRTSPAGSSVTELPAGLVRSRRVHDWRGPNLQPLPRLAQRVTTALIDGWLAWSGSRLRLLDDPKHLAWLASQGSPEPVPPLAKSGIDLNVQGIVTVTGRVPRRSVRPPQHERLSFQQDGWTEAQATRFLECDLAAADSRQTNTQRALRCWRRCVPIRIAPTRAPRPPPPAHIDRAGRSRGA